MNDNTFWILLSTAIAGSLDLLLGVVLGDEVSRSKSAEAMLRPQTPSRLKLMPYLDIFVT